VSGGEAPQAHTLFVLTVEELVIRFTQMARPTAGQVNCSTQRLQISKKKKKSTPSKKKRIPKHRRGYPCHQITGVPF
jgi:hypothetical protein